MTERAHGVARPMAGTSRHEVARYDLASRGSVLFFVLFFGLSAGSFVVVPMLSWVHLVPINGETGFNLLTLSFVVVGLVPTAIVARLVSEPHEILVLADGSMLVRSLLRTVHLPADEVEGIDADRRWVYWGDEDSKAPEDNPDQVVLLIRHSGGTVRLPHADSALALVAWLASRSPSLYISEHVRALLPPPA